MTTRRTVTERHCDHSDIAIVESIVESGKTTRPMGSLTKKQFLAALLEHDMQPVFCEEYGSIVAAEARTDRGPSIEPCRRHWMHETTLIKSDDIDRAGA